MTMDLFESSSSEPWVEPLCDGAVVLRRFARAEASGLLEAISGVAEQAQFRQMQTPGGHTMSVAMTCCGDWGWVTDAQGYRYQRTDPLSGEPWPLMPAVFRSLAVKAASAGGYSGFEPDACHYRARRSDRPQRVPLEHGDVVVWGGPARLRYHGVLTLKQAQHSLTGACRYNLTFRRAR